MNKIGIIFAMYEELEEMLKLVKLNKINKIYDLDFYECTINHSVGAPVPMTAQVQEIMHRSR